MTELVTINKNGNNVTTSLIIAEIFDKRHDNVIRDIQNMECSPEFNALNFEEIKYSDSRGRIQTAYEITKDGFSFLVMGYTGAKAGEFKEKFINEFNKREAMLKSDDYIIERAMSVLASRTKLLEAQLEAKTERLQLQESVIKESAPKVEYYEEVLQSKATYTSTQVSKEVGFRHAEQLHLELKVRGVMFKQSGQWMLTAKYSEIGYTKPRTSPYLKSDGTTGTNTITVWTEKGRVFIHNAIKQTA